MASPGAEWIASLRLEPHPEGGFYRETYRAQEAIEAAHLPARFGGRRVHSTAIYFLLPGDHMSALHRIKSDEVWHFYALVGGTVAPGFDFADFDLATRASLLAQFPQHGETILRLTR